MSKLERITVTLPESMAATLRAAVDSGQYATTSEIVREALRDWHAAEELRLARLARMREMIAEADASEALDGPTVVAEVQEYVRLLVTESKADQPV